MKRINIILICVVGFLCSGCSILSSLLGNVNGWDLSACVSDFGICWELYCDNSDKFDIDFINNLSELQ